MKLANRLNDFEAYLGTAMNLILTCTILSHGVLLSL